MSRFIIPIIIFSLPYSLFINSQSLPPTIKPSKSPSSVPSTTPIRRPTLKPSRKPSLKPSFNPSRFPSFRPSSPTKIPTSIPSQNPSRVPTLKPSQKPSKSPSSKPTRIPSNSPTRPTRLPTYIPSFKPTRIPSGKPSRSPSAVPSRKPTVQPSISQLPTAIPSLSPTREPTVAPTSAPTIYQVISIGSDPLQATGAQHSTQVEPDSFSFGSTTVAAVQTGRYFDGGSQDICWATSIDSAETWTTGCLSKVSSQTGGSYQRASDPSVTYDAKHGVWLISYLLFSPDTASAVGVSRSTDGGLTWSTSPVIAINVSPYLDKDWIVCDNSLTSPYYGHCYVQIDTYRGNAKVLMSTSTNGGLSWGTAIGTTNSNWCLGGQPLVQPGGRVIVPALGNSDSIVSYRSNDGGTSWTDFTTIAYSTFGDGPGGIRTGPLPSAEIDGNGKVYVVWSDCRFRAPCSTLSYDIVYSTTMDGVTWTTVTRVPIDPLNSGIAHFIPGIGVDRLTSGSSAHIALTYYYMPDSNCLNAGRTCGLYVGFVSSSDAGSTWSSPITLTGPMAMSWIPITNAGIMVGDYISTSFHSNGRAVPIFVKANPKYGTSFDVRLSTVYGAIPVTTTTQ
eukprot:gene938-1816_t